MRNILIVFLGLALAHPASAAETREDWVRLGARVHGGYGAFIPLGIRIGLDAAQTLRRSRASLQ